MSFRTRKDDGADALDLAYAPTGGAAKKWLAGGLLALLPIMYGVECIERGRAVLFGRDLNAELTGEAGFWLAVAYIAFGAFVHFHYFWGLSDRLRNFSQLGKALSLLVFLPSLFYTFLRMLA